MRNCDSLPQVLANISVHLDALAGKAFELEETVGDSLSNTDGEAKYSTVTELQALDFLRQSLEDTALLVHMLGSEAASAGSFSLQIHSMVNRLKLNSTKTLLEDPKSATNAIPQNGELDLF